MKKIATLCFAVACVMAVIVAIIVSVGKVRTEKLRESPPLTCQEVERLAEKLTPPAAANPVDKVRPQGGSTSPTNLPRRLNRPATDAQRRALYAQDRTFRARVAALVFANPLGSFFDAAGVAVGRPEGMSLDLGTLHLVRGHWAEAKRCCAEVVRKSSDPGRVREAYAHLAWLEEDPELAARYMELASSGNEVYPAELCMLLSKRIGSKELAAHYTRLFEEARKDLPKDSTWWTVNADEPEAES